MKSEFHICMGCGRDTSAKGEVCRKCYSNAEKADDPKCGWFADNRDDYDKEVDNTYWFDTDTFNKGNHD